MNMLHIDPAAQIPPYEQLRRQLIEQIQSGQLPEETRLPAVRRLAADLGIAPGTVARAYKGIRNRRLPGRLGAWHDRCSPNIWRTRDHGTGTDNPACCIMHRLGLSTDDIVAAVHRAIAG